MIETTDTSSATTRRPSLGARASRLADAALTWALGTKHALYSWALFRIVNGVIILLVLVTSWTDRHYLWGVGSRFIDPVADNRGYPFFFEAVFVKSNAVAFDVAYVLLGILAVVFAAGWRTRYVAPVLLVFWMGLSVNSTLLTNGGDTIMRVTLLFACFANMSAHWSVDAWFRRRKGVPESGAPRRWPPWIGNLLHNTALVLCMWQILLVYAASALYKFEGTEWRDGSATYYSLALDVFRPVPWLNDLVMAWDLPLVAMTYATLGLQLLFPVFIVWRPTRVVALVGVTGLHLGIGLFMGLWSFSLAMIACDFLFVRDSTWRWMLDWARTRVPLLRRRPAPVPRSEPAPVGAGGDGYPV